MPLLGRLRSGFLNRRFTAGLGATVLATSFALPFSQGSAGIGDSLYPDYGNGGYDVGHSDIHVTYHPSTKKLVGTTTITATATQHLTRFDLDFVLTARHVTVNGQTAKFSQHLVTTPHDNFGGELVVTPKTALHKGSALKIVVTYDGTPAKRLVNGFTPWVTTKTGAVALGEPEAAAWWFPSNDHPRDKATYDITMHMPKGLQGIANGVLVSHTTKGTGTTWHWRESQPMATYLAFAAMGSYTLTTTHSNGLPVYTAIAKKVGPFGKAATKDVKRTAEVIAWESTLFGPYPFNAEGAVVPDGTFDYALENQTKPVYDRIFWDSGPAMYVVAHENAHEWFGDSVSVDQWKDIWLNEGFATYAEWLWSEHAGEGSAESVFESFYNLFPASSDFWHTAIANPTIPQTFEDPVYDRGGMTLGALRNRIGDPDFFDLLQQWAALHKSGTVTTPEFIALAEQVSGQDLGSFFTAWLSTRSKPAATVANGFPPAAIAALRAGSTHLSTSTPDSMPDLLRTQALLTRGLHRP